MNAFLSHVDILQQITCDQTSSPEAVAGCLEKTFEIIRHFVSSLEIPDVPHQASTPGQRVRSLDQSEAETASTLEKVSKLMPVLLQAMDRLDQRNHDQALEGPVIYKFIMMFEDTLRQVCELAANDGQSTTTTPDPSVLRRTNRRHTEEIKSNDSTTATSRRSRITLDLCELAVGMTTALKATKPMQASMLEGCLSLLLTRVGSGLKSCVFGVASHGTIDDQTPNPERDQARADRTLEVQGPYLIYILERVPKTMSDGCLQAPGSFLLRSAKKKFQNSLLNSVFGETALGLIKPSLEIPKPPTNLRHFAGVETVEVRDWYKSEVWKLVGWDVLDEYLRTPVQQLRTTA